MTDSHIDRLALMNQVYRDFISDFSEEAFPPVSRSLEKTIKEGRL